MGNKASCCRAAEAKAEDQLATAEGDADVAAVTDAPASGPEKSEKDAQAEVAPAAEGAAGLDVDVTSEPKKDPPADEAVPPVDLKEPAVDPEAALDERDIALVQYTWSLAEPLGAEAVGKILFEKIFEIAPPALQLFPFKDAGHPSELSLKHGAKVVSTVSTAVGLLGDLPTLVPVLEKLGLQHVGYSVQPEHYDVVGQALLQTLGGALGDKFTDPVKNAWTKVYGVMSKTMIGNHYKKVEAVKAAAATDDDKKKKEASAKKKAADDKKKKEAAAKKKAADDKKAKEDAEKKKKEEAEQKKKDDEEAAKAIKAGLKAKEQAWKKLDKKDADEKTKKLHAAVKSGDSKTVKEMLEGDVWIEAADKDGWTAMIVAGHAGKLDMIKMLIDFGGDPLAKVALGEWGNTAIHYASREGHRDVVKFLMKHKVGKKALTIKNHNGKTPAQMAKDSVADLFE